jgi:hypothetical protein
VLGLLVVAGIVGESEGTVVVAKERSGPFELVSNPLKQIANEDYFA